MELSKDIHPSTALCLSWLDENPPKNKCMIDYGCGSGVLSIAALNLGARHVWAIDIDPKALSAIKNNITHHCFSSTQIITAFPEENTFKEALLENPVDLIISNIMAYPLIDLASEFARFLKPGGHIVLSGILSEQTDRLQKAYDPNFLFGSEKILNGWTCLEFKRK